MLRGRTPVITNLAGHLLVSPPGGSSRHIVYVCEHADADHAAFGLRLDSPVADMSFSEVLLQQEIITLEESQFLPDETKRIPVLHGGDNDGRRGFILHSSDVFLPDQTQKINEMISLTRTPDLLRAIGRRTGPRRVLFAIGSRAWSPGAVTKEIFEGDWLVCPGEPEIVFGANPEEQYAMALAQLGLNAATRISAPGFA